MSMTLDTAVIDAATLTGYVRAALADSVTRRPTLASFLPIQTVDSIHVDFEVGQAGLAAAANFRAFSAAPDPTTAETREIATIRLPGLGAWVPITEADAMIASRGKPTAEALQGMAQRAAKRAVDAVLDRLEATMGLEIATGKAVVKTGGFSLNENFGRAGALTTTAGTLWSDASADPLEDLETWAQSYADADGTGERPGAMIVSSRVANALAGSGAFKTVLAGGGERRATRDQVNDTLAGSGLPTLWVYDRTILDGKTTKRVLPDDSVFFVPAPVDPLNGVSALGATFMGPTLSAAEDEWRIPEEDRAGVVAGLHKSAMPPHNRAVYADATGLPVLANANLSMAAKVL